GSTKLYDPQEEVGRGIKAPHGSIEEVMKGLRDNYLEFLEKDTEKNLKVLPYFKTIRTRLNELPLKRVEVVCGGIFRGMNANEQKILEGAMEGVCYGILPSQIFCPCLLELIWSYWHEEGMLVQTMNTISLRFQNRPAGRNSLAELDIDPLRPINSILWGYISDEQHRLTLARRCYEYDHHYGLRLEGIAVPQTRGVDSRSKFLEAFHNLLSLTTAFYKQDDNITVVADGFPLLNALKDVHLLLAQGMHNQYGDLPWNARMEMLMQQWILARPEMRDFLRGRVMVPYPEAWMDRVDAMKGLQGWTDSTVIHFRDLGVYGEQILLSIRFGNWMKVDDADSAANWARYWRSEIKGYIHAYRAVTGVDLTTEGSDPRQANLRNMSPAIHLRNRQAAQSRNS
ncbi:MAG: hypothetical protein KKD99_13260, partial [Proteobacteria bacterium]|nr:hypothetical protein [Pseudomonadota bacterium]